MAPADSPLTPAHKPDSSSHREPFGATAVRLGFAKPEDVRRVLEEQHARRARGKKPNMIGVLMEEMGIISSDQLARIVRQLGEEKNPVTEDAIHIAARIRAAHPDGHSVLLVSGTQASARAAATAVQIAASLALMEEESVCLIDADLRCPSLHDHFGLAQGPGLTELLQGSVSAGVAVRPSGFGSLSLLPCGDVLVDFLSLLMSHDFPRVLAELGAAYRYVIVLGPPFLDFPDATLIAGRGCDGVVLAVPAGTGRRAELREIKRVLDGLNAPITGVVVVEGRLRERRLFRFGRPE